MSQRRKAREVALQSLFEVSYTHHDPESVVQWLAKEAGLSQETMLFVHSLVVAVVENNELIDATIQKFASAWPLEQIAMVDRNIMRLGVYEILARNVSHKVAINEAVELAKTFGTESSPRFINGVLGSVYADVSK